ncbi:MAG TPA: hypothetical protein VFA77_16625 [Candidatus Eisenbacteria bacterium]|nr:hypothetical protein [Candidatus Eisenbacteria bacterium]
MREMQPPKPQPHQAADSDRDSGYRHSSHRPPNEVGHWVRTAGILAPLVIGELVKDPEKKWRFIRIFSVSAALISEGLYTHRIHRERRERESSEYQRG